MQDRDAALKNWLFKEISHSDYILTPLAGDASFRCYYRLHDKTKNYVVMDAPPSKEPVETFIKISHILGNNQILAPQVHAANKTDGFLILDDFGDILLLKKLNHQNVDHFYLKAISLLNNMQSCREDALPIFDKEHMLKEMSLFRTWFLEKYLSLKLSVDEEMLINKTIDWLSDEIMNLPQTFIHRDFHSRNIMIIDDELGVIDFQDAMKGPFVYDLVSLLKDCYITWPRDKVLNWVSHFHKTNKHYTDWPLDKLIKAFDLCGLQRHIKVLGIFSRLYLRDNKRAYLQDLPRTLNYVEECINLYPELKDFALIFKNRISLP